MKIQVKAGNDLRAKLATTVSVDNLLTEPVKNSLQNNATVVRIDYNDNKVTVADNGDGFDHNKDKTGMNEFEKYFVFGNSYTKSSKQLNLGEMGIGGKAANDRLSDIKNTHWTITSKNKHNKSHRLTFKSTDEQYIQDLQPDLIEVPQHETQIPWTTGARIEIHNVNPQIKQDGWPDHAIRDNLQLFFNMLYFQTKDQNRPFNLWLNGKQIQFNNTLPGDPWMHERVNFKYMEDGRQHNSWYELKLNMIESDTKSLLNCVDLVSYTRVQKMYLNPNTIEQVIEREFEHATSQDIVAWWAKHIRGYILCPDITDVKDSNGMGAKDLSHHRIHPDHPITKPFLESLHAKVGTRVHHHLEHILDPKTQLQKTLNRVTGEIYKSFNVPQEFVRTEHHTVTEIKTITK
jgi:hypothetical protein